MAKAASPVRLDQELMSSAAHAARMESRSAAEQVEYWARIGRVVSRFLKPSDISLLVSGSVRLSLAQQPSVTLDPQQVFGAVETARGSGALSKSVTSASVRYQASSEHPGLLECIDSEGRITLGTFLNGEFVPEQGAA